MFPGPPLPLCMEGSSRGGVKPFPVGDQAIGGAREQAGSMTTPGLEFAWNVMRTCPRG